MAEIVVLGAGVSGHTAALHLNRLLPAGSTVTVVSPSPSWNWIPSNIRVGVGRMPKESVVFALAPVYATKGITFHQARAVTILPDGDEASPRGAVDIVHTGPDRTGEQERIRYHYLVNATGPQLRFDLTPGLGPDGGHTASVCTADHAVAAAARLRESIELLRAGVPQTLVVGMGHGTCTCEGAAFEYVLNVDHELREAGVRDRARLVYLTNEARLGDFGVDGITFGDRGSTTSSQLWTSSLFREHGIEAIVGAHVHRVEPEVISFETLDGARHELDFDFAMLMPPFGGVPLRALSRDGADITSQLFTPNGFMRVDADYLPKPYEMWRGSDWPSTYQALGDPRIFAVGIAFAPPHQISRPRVSPTGTVITPSPPRTGMPSGVMGKTAALTIVDRVKHGAGRPAHEASMAQMGAATVASAGAGLRRGSAAALTILPVVPDYSLYPTGRDLADTHAEIGLSGHWSKLLMHHLFLYKAQGRLGWQLIPW